MQNELKNPDRGRRKVLIVENSLNYTGAFNSALLMASIIRDIHDVEFLLPTRSKLMEIVEAENIVCHRLPMIEIGRSWKKILIYLPMLMINSVRLRKLLSEREIDILFINDYYNLLGVMVRTLAWGGRTITMVRLMPFNQHRLLNVIWGRLASIFSSNVIAVSNAVRDQLPASNKVSVIYSACDWCEGDFVEPVEKKDGVVSFLYPANYIHGKGHAYALKAFVLAYRENPMIRLRFVGGDMGLKKNINLKTRLKCQIAKLNLQEKVVLHDFSSDIRKEIYDADVVMTFSESESFSNTCLEASACGRPIIATRCGGPEEIVSDTYSGFLVPVRDVDAMAKAMLRLSKNRSLRVSMGMAGKSYINDRFSTRKFAKNLFDLCNY